MKAKGQGLTKKQIEQIRALKHITQPKRDAIIKAIKTSPSPEEQYQKQESLAKKYGFDLWVSPSEQVALHHLSKEEQKEFRELNAKSTTEWLMGKLWFEGRRLMQLRDKIKKATTPEDLKQIRKEEEKRVCFNKEFLAWVHQEIERLTAEVERLKKEKRKWLPEKVIVPGHYSDARFTTEETAKQLLFDFERRAQIKGIMERGFESIDLSLDEDRVMHGIHALLTETNYCSNELQIRESQIYEAVGLKKIKTARGKWEYSGRETEKITNALISTAKRNFDIVFRQYAGFDSKTKKTKYRVAVTYEPLYKLAWVYKDIDGDKLESFDQELTSHRRKLQHIQIAVNPLTLTDVRNYYKLMPGNLYLEIKGIKGPEERVTKYEPLFIHWLHKQEKKKVEINRYQLAEQLKMGKYIKISNYPVMDKTLLRCYRIAKKLGYLLHYKLNVKGKKKPKDVFYLNSEKFEHLKRGKKGVRVRKRRT